MSRNIIAGRLAWSRSLLYSAFRQRPSKAKPQDWSGPAWRAHWGLELEGSSSSANPDLWPVHGYYAGIPGNYSLRQPGPVPFQSPVARRGGGSVPDDSPPPAGDRVAIRLG